MKFKLLTNQKFSVKFCFLRTCLTKTEVKKGCYFIGTKITDVKTTNNKLNLFPDIFRANTYISN